MLSLEASKNYTNVRCCDSNYWREHGSKHNYRESRSPIIINLKHNNYTILYLYIACTINRLNIDSSIVSDSKLTIIVCFMCELHVLASYAHQHNIAIITVQHTIEAAKTTRKRSKKVIKSGRNTLESWSLLSCVVGEDDSLMWAVSAKVERRLRTKVTFRSVFISVWGHDMWQVKVSSIVGVYSIAHSSHILVCKLMHTHTFTHY